jgi:hypothetical protein
MKKLGLLSVAAAVALTSSAFATEIKVSGMASVSGISKTVMTKEANEYYDMDSEIHLNVKNDDGITVKLGWDIYDGKFIGDAANGATVSPDLIYGYVVAPLGDLTLKTGFIEAGPFGPAAFDTDASSFKMSAAYKINDMLTIALTDKQQKEGDNFSKNGGFGTEGGEGDKSTFYIDAKIKAAGFNVGLRSYTTTDTKTVDGGTDDVKTAGTDIFLTGDVAGVNVAVERVTSKADSANAKEKAGMYAHGLVGIGNITTGLAYLTMTKGQTSGTLFDATVMTDQVFDQLASGTTKDTTIMVVPVIAKISDKLTVNAAYATGEVGGVYNATSATYATTGTASGSVYSLSKALSYTEMNLGASYALGKQTTVSATYANATAKALESTTDAEAGKFTYMNYKVAVQF